MREVDEALARAYAQRDKGDPPQGVPPAPHWPAQSRSHTPASRARSRRPRTGRVPAPATAGPPDRSAELQWPALVLTLEREWGERFERMAELLIEVPAAAEPAGHPLHQLPSRRGPDDPGADPGPRAVRAIPAAPCWSTPT